MQHHPPSLAGIYPTYTYHPLTLLTTFTPFPITRLPPVRRKLFPKDRTVLVQPEIRSEVRRRKRVPVVDIGIVQGDCWRSVRAVGVVVVALSGVRSGFVQGCFCSGGESRGSWNSRIWMGMRMIVVCVVYGTERVQCLIFLGNTARWLAGLCRGDIVDIAGIVRRSLANRIRLDLDSIQRLVIVLAVVPPCKRLHCSAWATRDCLRH